MSNPRIEVEVVAKVDGLSAGVTAASGQLDKLGKAVQTTAPQVDKLTRAASRYNSVGIDFARVIQDAPFGIIGVGNNIQQLSASFSNLGNAGDSVSTKLKTAFSSIFSSGNALVLAVSVLTTAFTIYQQNSEKTVSINDKVKQSYDELADSVDYAVQTLATLDFINDLVNKQIDEVIKLDKSFNLFTSSAEDFNKITKDAFSNLNEGQLTGLKRTLTGLANDQLKKVGNQLNLNRKETVEFIKGLEGNTAAFEALDPKIRDAVGSYDSLQGKVKIVNQQLDFYNEKEKKVGINKEALEAYSAAWDEYNLQVQLAQEFQDKLTFSIKDYEDAILKLFKTAANPVKVKIELDAPEPEKPGEVPFDVFLDSLQLKLNKLPSLRQQIEDFAFAVDNIIRNNLVDSFSQLGFVIGETLANSGNVLQAIGGSILTSFANFLGQFGQQLIAYGVAASAFGKVSLALAVPGAAIIAAPVAIAAGVALTAIAGVIGTIGQRGLSASSGGGNRSVGGGSAAQGTSFAGGATGGMFNINREIRGEFVVRGTDLVYVLGQAQNKINKG
jgi:hypothetical protein